MAGSMKEIGKIITCMAKACIFGGMEGNMRASISMTRSMVSACIHGLMAKSRGILFIYMIKI